MYSLLYSLAFLLPDDALLRVSSVIACALHFQLERIARTEGLGESQMLKDVQKTFRASSSALTLGSGDGQKKLAQGNSLDSKNIDRDSSKSTDDRIL